MSSGKASIEAALASEIPKDPEEGRQGRGALVAEAVIICWLGGSGMLVDLSYHGAGHTALSAPEAGTRCTLDGQIVWYVNCISVKLFKKRIC